MKKLYCLFVLVSQLAYGYSQNMKSNTINFVENKKQWPLNEKYRADIGNGIRLSFQTNSIRYLKFDENVIHDFHFASIKEKQNSKLTVHGFEMEFLSSRKDAEIVALNKQSYYYNYFLGNDPNKWASEAAVFEKLQYKKIYNGIDIFYYSQNNQFKYDFVIDAGAKPEDIKLQYKGINKLQLLDNHLYLETAAGQIIEDIPYSYQEINGVKKEVKCMYKLNTINNTIQFYFPEGYNSNYQLIIDPVIVAGTFSGSTPSTDTFGHSASYDNAGNIYTGGECFGVGYPSSTGVIQTAYAGMQDMVLSKFNPNGSQLIWCTYFGGGDIDLPNSLFITPNQELYIYGVTFSTNFPTTSNCYSNAIKGASDLIVAHLNKSATQLVGSTYLGGSLDDGYFKVIGGNISTFHQHDGMRGEIIVDNSGDAYVASYTESTNFPTSTGAFDASHNGQLDGCVFKISGNMSTLNWSTFIGGSANDAAYSLRINKNNEVYITGFSESTNFPTTNGAYQTSFQGGILDGFVVKLNSGATSILSSTYIGTNAKDISYFIDLDQNQDPFLFGNCRTGALPVSSGAYSNAKGSNFICKLDKSLSTMPVSTVIGDPNNPLEPAAFMVDSCNQIYLAGFGSTTNYPVTANALFSQQPLLMSCYLMCLSANAKNLLFGSFYYGDHVDGGTSRFDPSGKVYLGLCACHANTKAVSWAFDQNNSKVNCDMFVVKIDFEMSAVKASASISPNDTVCIGSTIQFNNTSSNGQTFSWNFGDASATSNSFNPTHLYNLPGNYTVSFFASNPAVCKPKDSTYLKIVVLPILKSDFSYALNCNGVVEFNQLVQNANCTWIFGDGTVLNNVSNPSHEYLLNGSYNVGLFLNAQALCRDTIYHTIVINKTIVEEIIAPNFFSPNNDGVNDCYKMKGNPSLILFSLEIYDRWGKKMFETMNPEICWNGKVEGKMVNDGVYYYLLKYKENCDTELKTQNGFLTLMQ